MNYQHICEQVSHTALRAGNFIAQQRLTFSSDKVEQKGKNDLVSYVDKQAEQMIVADLLKIVPEAAILGEEGTAPGNGVVDPNQYCWIIDPLDGTTNFVHGLPPYCVSIALVRGNEILAGVIYEITRNETFSAWAGSKAYLNGAEISVSSETQIANSLIMTGMVPKSEDQRERFNELFDYFNRNSHGGRRSGSAAANLAYIAAGRAECFFQRGLSPWDVAAGALIVQQAGGCVTDYANGPNYLFTAEIVATNGRIHQETLDIVR